MHRVRIFLRLALLHQSTFDLRCPVLLVPYTQIQIFDLLFQGGVLRVERIDELLHVNSLVTSFVHALEESINYFVEAIPQFVLFLWRGLTAHHAHLIPCKFQHV